LDQHRIIEAETVIASPTDPERIFLHRTKPGRRLAGAGYLRLVRLHRLDDARGGRCNAAQMAQEVEGHALGAKQAACRAMNDSDRVTRPKARSVRALDLYLDRRIQ